MNRIARTRTIRYPQGISALHQQWPDYIGTIELARAFAEARPVLQTFIGLPRIERELAYRLGGAYAECRAEAQTRAVIILKHAMDWQDPENG